MHVPRIHMQLQRLSADALELVRALSGREVRATLLETGRPEANGARRALLRLGGRPLEARLEGGAAAGLKPGAELRLRIEPGAGPGESYRLVLLGGRDSGGTASTGVLPQLPSFVSARIASLVQQLFGLRSASTPPAGEVRNDPASRGRSQRLETLLRTARQSVPGISASPLLQAAGASAEEILRLADALFVLDLRSAREEPRADAEASDPEASQNRGDGDAEPGTEQGENPDGDSEEGRTEFEEDYASAGAGQTREPAPGAAAAYAAGLGRLEFEEDGTSGAHFFALETRLPRLGAVTALAFAESADFTDLHLLVQCERPAAERLLLAEWPAWLAELRARGVRIEAAQVVPRSAPAGGLDLRA